MKGMPNTWLHSGITNFCRKCTSLLCFTWTCHFFTALLFLDEIIFTLVRFTRMLKIQRPRSKFLTYTYYYVNYPFMDL